MPSVAAAAAQIKLAVAPVVFLDTCVLLDVVRSGTPLEMCDRRQLTFPFVLPHQEMLPCETPNATELEQRFPSAGGRIFRLSRRPGPPRRIRTSKIYFYLVLSATTASVTVGRPGETESGSAGEQPDEG